MFCVNLSNDIENIANGSPCAAILKEEMASTRHLVSQILNAGLLGTYHQATALIRSTACAGLVISTVAGIHTAAVASARRRPYAKVFVAK
jgi:hypothetical protein